MDVNPTHRDGDHGSRRPGAAGARTLGELCAVFVDGHGRRDRGLLTGLYLDSARLVLADGTTPRPVSPTVGIEDRLRLGLPLRVTVRHVFEDGWRAHVRLSWSVEGTTPDGTELEMAGTGSLDCEKRGHRWYIAAEWLRHEAPGPLS